MAKVRSNSGSAFIYLLKVKLIFNNKNGRIEDGFLLISFRELLKFPPLFLGFAIAIPILAAIAQIGFLHVVHHKGKAL